MENDPNTGNEVLVWRTERGSKTRHGQDKPGIAEGHFFPTAQVTNNCRCPLHYYEAFMSQSPEEFSNPDSSFFLAIKHNRKAGDKIWYKKCPVGKNKIGKLLSSTLLNCLAINI